jgi:hypothetical protein
MVKKVCACCKEEKNIDCFNKEQTRKDGLGVYCRECLHDKYMANRDNRIATVKRRYDKKCDEIKSYNRERYHKSSEKIAAQVRDYYKNNKSKVLEYKKEYRQRDESKQNYNKWKAAYKKKRFNDDIDYKLKYVISSQVRRYVKGELKTKKAAELVGCSMEKLRKHIESQFKEGMLWNNHGFYGWHIDHIIPCASFDLADIEQQKKCFHYTNLQPLWAEENLKKGAKII